MITNWKVTAGGSTSENNQGCARVSAIKAGGSGGTGVSSVGLKSPAGEILETGVCPEGFEGALFGVSKWFSLHSIEGPQCLACYPIWERSGTAALKEVEGNVGLSQGVHLHVDSLRSKIRRRPC